MSFMDYSRGASPHSRAGRLTNRFRKCGKSKTLRSNQRHGWDAANASSACGVVIKTKLFTDTGAAALLFSSPSDNVFAGFPSFRFSTMAESVEKGVNNAPSLAVIGRDEMRPGS